MKLQNSGTKSLGDSSTFEVVDLSQRRKKILEQQKSLKRSISAKSQELAAGSQKRIPGFQINKSKDDYPTNEIEQLQFKLIQMEISDFVIIEHNKNGVEYQVLNEKDWKTIIKQKNYNGYRVMDLHVSLLTQNLFFQERRDLWLFLCQVENLKEKLKEKKFSFEEFARKSNNFSSQIDKDIPRTLLNCEFLKQKENRDSLKKILAAYASYDPELGYTQGMNIIAANLLICYDLKSNDAALEDVEIIDPQRDLNVFYFFIFIMIEQNWRSIFLPGFPGLIRMMKILTTKLQKELPILYQHFQEINVDLNVCFQQQYLSLLMYGLSWQISRMIFDLFLFEGEEIIHTFIIGMLQLCQEQLLRLYSFDVRLLQMQEVIVFCRGEMIRQFYGLFELQLNGKKNFTNTLHSLGIIKVQKQIVEQPIQPAQNCAQQKIGKIEQIRGAGKFIKGFFTRK